MTVVASRFQPAHHTESACKDEIECVMKAYDVQPGDTVCFVWESDDPTNYPSWIYVIDSYRNKEDGCKWTLKYSGVAGASGEFNIQAWQEFGILEQTQTTRTLSILAQRPILNVDF